ncbi:hypothetical protein ACP4OV_019106 [Aristida adscensionis]
MATSPLPRWAPTPSPSGPLWRPSPAAATTPSSFRAMLGALCGRIRGAEAPPPAQAAAEDVTGGGREDGRGGGVFITWEDVWVTAAEGRRQGSSATILHGVSGSARPGEVLAIMGPSGCGKTTLLDALAGFAYVTQENMLMSTLTVREAIYYSAQIQLPDTMMVAEKLARADETIVEMGLAGAAETRIGGGMDKGISGGERKRVSICLEILTRPRLLFLDEPTSGLDSAASFHVMSRITGLAASDGMTVVAVVHQPCGEVFELFHDLCLLAAGKTIFFGLAAHAAEFFTSNGYPCPPMRNPSNHFLRTINRDFDHESGERSPSIPSVADEAIEILVNAYKSSNTSEIAKKEMQDINQMDAAMITRNQASFWTKVLVLTKRSFVNMYRDAGYYWLRLGIYVTISLCLGTIFYNFGYGYNSIRSRSSMLMFVAGLLTLMAIGGFPSFVEDMKGTCEAKSTLAGVMKIVEEILYGEEEIFRTERLNGHYGVLVFVICNSLSATPYLVFIAVLPGAIAYYLTGLQRGVDHFAYFILVLCSCTMLVEGLMMIIAAVVPNYLMGIITGAGVQGIMMLNCGFFQIPSRLPKIVWKYPMYYVSFHKYALHGLYKNEFLGLVLQNNHEWGDKTISGEQVITKLFEVDMGTSKWVDLAVLCGMVVEYRLLFVIIIMILDNIKPMVKGARFRSHIQCT